MNKREIQALLAGACLLICALGFAAIGILSGCSLGPVLEEGGHYAQMGESGSSVYQGDDLVRDYYRAANDFRIWANTHAQVVADSDHLTYLKSMVDEQLTPPLEPDNPLGIYFALRDAWVITQDPDAKANFYSQSAIIENLLTQLLTAVQ